MTSVGLIPTTVDGSADQGGGSLSVRNGDGWRTGQGASQERPTCPLPLVTLGSVDQPGHRNSGSSCQCSFRPR